MDHLTIYQNEIYLVPASVILSVIWTIIQSYINDTTLTFSEVTGNAVFTGSLVFAIIYFISMDLSKADQLIVGPADF